MKIQFEDLNNQQEALSAMLKSLVTSVGAVDALFHIDLNKPEVWLGKSWLKCLKQRQSILFSSSRLEETFEGYRKRLKSMDIELSKSVRKDLYSWSSVNSHAAKRIREGGYERVVSVSIPLATCSDLRGRFLYFYDGVSEQSEFEIRRSIENSLNEMIVYQTAVSASHLITSPLEDYGMLKSATISIIRHLSQGCSRTELSEVHHMTPRGIDYHLERAKCLLGAKNTHNLVHKSHSLLLI
ncbi:hypothetical protein [Ferrimonas sp. SCSIO 43195]|uniref:helix-turn-helix transcriptional regulator n=1 Tax=Ferrimonas sp. SCSIO 43195 TaxID=2822844 RepID=UPI002075DE43|nr:hypothetical protein [Ferrimonas sp. SCSIO 43195]USD36803.1 hypothetical protein J8Z22_17635 [Ferrimonas sp. SCSIO 43195]